MRIRNFRKADLESCRTLWAEMTQRHREIYDDSSIGGEDPGFEFDAHLSLVGPRSVWVEEDDGQIVGLVSLIQDDEQAEVEPLIVSVDRRGQGIGTRLLHHAVERARDTGALMVSVKPVARNVEAISFFHEAGFTTLGHIQLFMWLGPASPGKWKEGPVLFGKPFDL